MRNTKNKSSSMKILLNSNDNAYLTLFSNSNEDKHSYN